MGTGWTWVQFLPPLSAASAAALFVSVLLSAFLVAAAAERGSSMCSCCFRINKVQCSCFTFFLRRSFLVGF